MAVVKNRYSWIWSLELAALDLISLYLCLLIALLTRKEVFFESPFSGVVFVLQICLNWVGLSIIDGYNSKREMCSWRYASEHFLAMIGVLFISFLMVYTIATFDESIKPSRAVLFFSVMLFSILSFHYRYVFSSWCEQGASQSPVYVIGAADECAYVQSVCTRMKLKNPIKTVYQGDAKAFLLNLFSEFLPESGISPTQWLGNRCEAIVIDLDHESTDPQLENLVLKLNLQGIAIYPVRAFIENYFYKIDSSSVRLTDALDGTFRPDYHSPYGNFKTLVDFLFSIGVILIALPVMVMIAIIIKLQDGGPVLFKQIRIGRFEQPFLLFKFRTMKVVSGKRDLYTLKNDSRITKFGRFLRLTRMDELPQLWNVVRGEMSMIGPRAECAELVEEYKQKIRLYNLRSMVKPGITGWAQVNYGYGGNLNDTLEKLQYDLYYIKHYSPKLDAGIVLKTLYVILSASGQ